MAVDRAWYNTLVNDDGSNTVGTIWDKAAVNSLINAIDSDTVVGTWTPTDTSGAGLTFAVDTAWYVRKARMVAFMASLTWPVTANGAGAAIGGLPYVPSLHWSGSVGYTGYGSLIYVTGNAGASSIIISTAGSVSIANSALSAKTLRFFGLYLTP